MRTPFKPRMSQAVGVTLNELLIAASLVGILAGLAYPTMGKVLERGYWNEGREILGTIYAAERAYFFRTQRYFGILRPCDDDPPNRACYTRWRQIDMDDPSRDDIPVQFFVTVDNSAIPPTFQVTAIRVELPLRRMWLDQDRQFNDGTWPRP